MLSEFPTRAGAPSEFNDSGRVARACNKYAPLRALAMWLGCGEPAKSRSAAGKHKQLMTADKPTLVKMGDEMLMRARRNGQPFSMVIFSFSDLQELRSVFGTGIARQLVAAIAGKLQILALNGGLALRTGPQLFTVLLPGFDRDRTLSLIQRTLGHPCCIELGTGNHELVSVPDFIVHTVSREVPSIAGGYDVMCRDVSRMQLNDQRRNSYLQRERESHTRAMPPSEPPGTGKPRHAAWVEPTMPVPLRKQV